MGHKFRFGDIFYSPDTGKPCVVISFIDERNWWYAEKDTSIIKRAKFLPTSVEWECER